MADGDLTFGVAIKSTGDSSVTADAKAATTELENMKKATDDLAAASVKQASQSRASENDIMRYYTGLSVAEDNAKAKAWALANGYQEVGGVMVKAAEEAEAGMNKTAFATHRAYTEMVVLAREASRGNFSRMAGSATILAQGLSPLALGIAGVTAALALGAYAWEKMTNEVDAETAAAQENEKQINAISMKLEDQIVLLKQRTELSAQGITGASDEEVKKIFQLEQTITRIKGDMADGVKIGRDGFYLSEDLVKAQTELNRLKDDENTKQALTNQLKADGHGKNLYADQEKALDKTYADAQRLDAQMVESHQSAFDKTIDAWIAMKQKMEAAGIYYGQLRKEHEEAYTAFVNAENLKRNSAAEAAAAKKEATEAKHQAIELINEKKHLALVDAARQNSDKTWTAKENLRFETEIINFQARYALAIQQHALSLAEEEAFEDQRDAIISAHLARQQAEGKAAFAQQLATSGTQFRLMFEINKEYQTGQAVMAGWKAVQDAYAWGSTWGGPVGGAAMAAVALAATAANVKAIQSAQFGGGTGASGAGGGGGGAAVTTPSPLAPASPQISSTAPVAASPVLPPTQINLTIAGASNPNNPQFTYDQIVNGLVPLLNQAGANGVKINVNATA